MGACASSAARAEALRVAIRRCDAATAVDLEPLVLSDPQAQRAVTDFMRADSSGAGVLTTADFARTFRLDDDLFLRRLVALFDLDGDGGVALNEFLVGVAHFAGSTGVSRDVCIRRFAFKLMDVRGAGFVDRRDMERFIEVAYDEFTSKQPLKDKNAWGDTAGLRARAEMDVQACVERINAVCPGRQVNWITFQALAAELPLLVAPAAFIWTTFEDIAPACKFLCAAMLARGHSGFNAAMWGGGASSPARTGRAAEKGRARGRTNVDGDATRMGGDDADTDRNSYRDAMYTGAQPGAGSRSNQPSSMRGGLRQQNAISQLFDGQGSYRDGGDADALLREILAPVDISTQRGAKRTGRAVGGASGNRGSARVSAAPEPRRRGGASGEVWDSGDDHEGFYRNGGSAEDAYDEDRYGSDADGRGRGRQRQPPPLAKPPRGGRVRDSYDGVSDGAGGIGDYGSYATSDAAGRVAPSSRAYRGWQQHASAAAAEPQGDEWAGDDAGDAPTQRRPQVFLKSELERELVSAYEEAATSPRPNGQSRLAAASAAGQQAHGRADAYAGRQPRGSYRGETSDAVGARW